MKVNVKPRILILGATSSIAQAAAAEYAKRGYDLILAGRNLSALARIGADLQIRYQININTQIFETQDIAKHPEFIAQIIRQYGDFTGVLIAVGYLDKSNSASVIDPIIKQNFTGVASLLTLCADYLMNKRSGFIIVLSSVAGDRGRESNYIYGAAKAGLNIFCQGLRQRCNKFGVRIITVKLGIIDTPMTYGRAGSFLAASPLSIAKRLVDLSQGRRNSIYLPWFWRPLLAIICWIPEPLFKRLSL